MGEAGPAYNLFQVLLDAGGLSPFLPFWLPQPPYWPAYPGWPQAWGPGWQRCGRLPHRKPVMVSGLLPSKLEAAITPASRLHSAQQPLQYTHGDGSGRTWRAIAAVLRRHPQGGGGLA